MTCSRPPRARSSSPRRWGWSRRPTRMSRSCSGRTAHGSRNGTGRSRSASSTRAPCCAGWRRRSGWRARRPRPTCASASTRRRCRASRRAGAARCGSDATLDPVRRRLSGPVLVIAAAVALILLLPALIPALNPFKEETVDRSGTVLLKSLENLSEYRAASANLQVVVDVEKDTNLVPSFIKGERTLFVAAGNVDAAVDFSRLGRGAVRVSDDRKQVAITLPPARLTEARLDSERSRVYDRDRGALD